MDREILFRGKTISDDRWVYGDYCQSDITDDSIHINNGVNSGLHRVIDPKTVGQYIGLTDKNGKRIFEDDIVSFNGIKLKIAFKNSEFCVEHLEGEAWTYPYLGSNAKYMEVVGNIHDNPEQLEAK